MKLLPRKKRLLRKNQLSQSNRRVNLDFMKSESRTLQLDTVHNFRDIGGFLTDEGKFMKRGLYFRSDLIKEILASWND